MLTMALHRRGCKKNTKEDVDDIDSINLYAGTLASAFQDDPVENYVVGTDAIDSSWEKTIKLTQYPRCSEEKLVSRTFQRFVTHNG